MGFGMASVFATGFLWLENHTPVTSRIGALLSIFASLGPDVFPIIVGQFIERQPMVMMYVTLAAVIVCAALFSVAAVLGAKINGRKEKEGDGGTEEEMQELKT